MIAPVQSFDDRVDDLADAILHILNNHAGELTTEDLKHALGIDPEIDEPIFDAAIENLLSYGYISHLPNEEI